jgi:hypothetical protein
MPNRPFLSCAIAPETPAAENYRFTRRLTHWTFRSRADSARRPAKAAEVIIAFFKQLQAKFCWINYKTLMPQVNCFTPKYRIGLLWVVV